MTRSYKIAFVVTVFLCVCLIAWSLVSGPTDLPVADSTATMPAPVGDIEPIVDEAAEAPRQATAPRTTEAPRAKTVKAPESLVLGAPPPSSGVAATSTLFEDDDWEIDDAAPVEAPAAREGQATDAKDTPVRAEPDRGSVYTVRKGDTLVTIAEAHYGAGRYWQSIAHANPRVEPTRLKSGQTLRLPPRTELSKPDKDVPRPGQTRFHVVRRGESLWTIARQHYHRSDHWRIVYNANRRLIGRDPNRLKLGQRLRIPPAIVVPGRKG